MIIIPMAGESRRFKEAGFYEPKYMLKVHDKSLFRRAVESFQNYFKEEHFLFIHRNEMQTEEFVESECENMGLINKQQISLQDITSGQAETVTQGLQKADIALNTPITIFNIDTFRPGYIYPSEPEFTHADGFLEVFMGSGKNWSFVKPENSTTTKVEKTAEKVEISNLCCTGLYHFRSAELYLEAYNTPRSPLGEAEKKESYIAPLYNVLIKNGYDVRYKLIDRDDVVFCGVPEEYYEITK